MFAQFEADANSTCRWSGKSSVAALKCGGRGKRGGVFPIVKWLFGSGANRAITKSRLVAEALRLSLELARCCRLFGTPDLSLGVVPILPRSIDTPQTAWSPGVASDQQTSWPRPSAITRRSVNV